MIRSKTDYQYYLEADRIASNRNKPSGIIERLVNRIIIGDEVWEFQKLLRRVEYIKNCQQGIFGKIRYALALRKLHRLSIRLGFHIHPNNFGPGLHIVHHGTIVINSAARIGANCRIHPCTVIGTEAGKAVKSARIGNNVYIGPGVKIFGQIEIADDIAIGANAVVNMSFSEPGITIAGIPAKKVSDNGSDGKLIKATDILDQNKRKISK